MHIAIVNYTSGGLSGGYRKYLDTMIPLLRADPRIGHLDVFVPSQAMNLMHIDSELLHVWPADDMGRRFAWLKSELHKLAPDVVFIPTARWLNCGRIPTVVMVRNMEPLVVPFGGNSLTEGMKNLARAYTARQACVHASRVIAVSQYVRDFLIDNWHIAPEKVGCTYHGSDSPSAPTDALKPTSLRQNELGRFIFTAGSIRPARGLEDVIRAIAILAAREPDVMLVVGGSPDPGTRFYFERLQSLARGLGMSSRVVWAGQLNLREMSWCFYQCSVFAMTSRAEACPNTVLEAMNHGCLIVSTIQPPMPEFLGESALYYTPRNALDLAEKLAVALAASPEGQAARRRVALERARGFRWLDTARKTIDQLEQAISISSVLSERPKS